MLSLKEVKDIVGGYIFDVLNAIPFTRKKIEAEFSKIELDLESKLKPANREMISELPSKGLSHQEILSQMEGWAEKEKGRWREGFVSGAVYHGGNEHMKFVDAAYSLYAASNPLHTDLFPSVMKFETEVIAMTASLLDGGTSGVCGSLTSGGTESIFLSVKAHRDWARDQLGIRHPEIVVPITVHAAFDKACHLLGVRIVKVAVHPETQRAVPRRMARAVSGDTIMLVASAPQFPHGVIDPVADIAAIALKHGIGMHVDCCLGGFFLPFARALGAFVPPFDFGVPGVTAMSCDTHKYGYAAKGTSVLLFRTPEMRRYQYFAIADWPGGLYCTATNAGSRSGGVIAAAWASMMSMGEEGYLNATRRILGAVRGIRAAVEATPGLHVVGDPGAMTIAFGSHEFNIYSVNDKLSHKGWCLNALQAPPCVHLTVTLRHVEVVDRFARDLAEAVAEVRADPLGAAASGSAPMYGMTAALPAGPVRSVLDAYMDITLKL